MIVEDENVSTARDRRAGYIEALERAGIPLDPGLVVRAVADPRGGVLGMESLLRLDELPTAVFTVNNLVALGAIESVRAAGLEVPDDIAFVCFDDIEYASLLYPFLRLYPFHPFLTVMLQPAETFGTLGTQLLFERIEGRKLDRVRRVVLPGDFLVRESCGANARAA
jgi:LacI family transcriptional regulator